MKNKGTNVILILAFMMLGILMAFQFKSIKFVNHGKTTTEKKIEQLKIQLNEEKSIGEALKNELKDIESKSEKYLQSSVDENRDAYLREQLEKLEALKLKAGLTDVKGPGLVIKLNDAQARMNEDPKALIIHDTDVVKVLNELKKAGAQAISINGERIISTSSQICAGPTILINKKRYAVPFEIKAIGNPEGMYESVNGSEAVYYMLRDNIRVEITKAKEITIPKYSGNLDNLISALEVIER